MKKHFKCGFDKNCVLNEKHKGLCIFEKLPEKRNRFNNNYIKYCVRKSYPKKTNTNLYKLNQYVLSKYGSDIEEFWWPGKVIRVHYDNTYDIEYFDGDREKNKEEEKITKLEYDEDEIDGFIILAYKLKNYSFTL